MTRTNSIGTLAHSIPSTINIDENIEVQFVSDQESEWFVEED